MATSDWHPDGAKVFYKSDYTFDDAEKLAGLWDIPISEAKQVLGHKIINDIQDLLPEGLQEPKAHSDGLSQNFRAYVKSDYDYDDAELLASLWNMTIPDAKDEIGYKVLHRLEANLPDKLRENDIEEEHKVTDDDALTAYGKSDYTYDDAELLASLWNISVLEAKKTIGYKLIGNIEHLLPPKVKSHQAGNNAEDKAFDAYANSCYTYDDAELLGQLWNISTFEAKKMIGGKIINKITHLLPDKVGENCPDEEQGC